jgi:calpain-15
LAENGLVNGHAYSIIACGTVVGSDNKTANLVQIRNTWGSFEWNGDWSDNSQLWTDEARKKMG